jgi:hypothetical protein
MKAIAFFIFISSMLYVPTAPCSTCAGQPCIPQAGNCWGGCVCMVVDPTYNEGRCVYFNQEVSNDRNNGKRASQTVQMLRMQP